MKRPGRAALVVNLRSPVAIPAFPPRHLAIGCVFPRSGRRRTPGAGRPAFAFLGHGVLRPTANGPGRTQTAATRAWSADETHRTAPAGAIRQIRGMLCAPRAPPIATDKRAEPRPIEGPLPR